MIPLSLSPREYKKWFDEIQKKACDMILKQTRFRDAHVLHSDFLVDPFYSHTNTVKHRKRKLSIENTDILTQIKMFPSGLTVLLNMANPHFLGGGVRYTQGESLEERLCRSSTLYQALSTVSYPIKEDEIIYSSNVCIFLDKNYEFLEFPYVISIITAAVHSSPEIIDGHLSMKEWNFLEAKIRDIIYCAIIRFKRYMVLGPIGCELFHYPSEDVARIFYHYLIEENLIGYFDHVVFLIENENVRSVFQETFHHKI